MDKCVILSSSYPTYLATPWPSDGRASILAFAFILVPSKSPDQKQEVSSQIKTKIHFLFGF